MWRVASENEGSVVAVCGLCCSVACKILLPQPGMESTSPALQGGFLTTGALGRSQPRGILHNNGVNIPRVNIVYIFFLNHTIRVLRSKNMQKDSWDYFSCVVVVG